MEDRVEENVDGGSPIATLLDYIPIMDTELVSHVAIIVDALVVCSPMHDHIAMMDTELMSPLSAAVDVDAAMDTCIVSFLCAVVDVGIAMDVGIVVGVCTIVDSCILSPLTTIGVGSLIVNCIVSKGSTAMDVGKSMDRCKHIALRMEEVVNDIQMESATKVVDDNIIREQPYEPEDMVAEDSITSIPSDLSFFALKRVATTPMTLGEMPLKVPKIETKVGEPNALSRQWNSKHVPIDVIVIDSDSDKDAPLAIIESISFGAVVEMELKPSIQTHVETY